MIKKQNDSFSLIPFTAIVNAEVYVVDNKERFEAWLLNKLKYDKFIEVKKEGQRINLDDIEVTLPIISYSDNSLTAEQQERLDFINTFKTFSLDEAKDYVINDIEPTNLEYTTYKLKTDNQVLNEQLLSVMEVSAVLYEENLNLTMQNLEIMVVLAELYESVATGGVE